jgi:hypothetical protein
MEYSDLLMLALASVIITIVGTTMLIVRFVAWVAKVRVRAKRKMVKEIRADKEIKVRESEAVLS